MEARGIISLRAAPLRSQQILDIQREVQDVKFRNCREPVGPVHSRWNVAAQAHTNMLNFEPNLDQVLQSARQHHQAGRLAQAEALYREILRQNPRHADALHMLGVLAAQAQRHDLAVDLIRQAIALQPNLPEAHYNLGKVLYDQGQLDGAIAAYRQAIAVHPNYPEAHYNLGKILYDQGQLDAAIAAYHQAIALNPHLVEAHNNLGNALKDEERWEEAAAAYRQAIALNPALPEAHSNLSNVLREQGQPDAAIAACRQAIALQPNYPEPHMVLAHALRDEGKLDAAIAAYRQVVALNPNSPEAHSNLVFILPYHPGYDAQAVAEELRRWNLRHAEPLKTGIAPHVNDRNPERRLRIGYVSADFRGHACAYYLDPLLRAHDRVQVEIFGYAEVARPDRMTTRFQSLCQGWRNTVGQADDALAEQIRRDGIDILVDLKLHTDHNRLLVFARKPAPVQVTWLGYPGSTGLTTIDYRLSDPYLDPPGMDESVYSERTVRLPDTFWCYDPLDGRELPVTALPALETGVVTFGCLNNFCKINDGTLALWAQALRQVGSSRLLLLTPEGSHRQAATEVLAREGVAGDRIEFVPRRSRRDYMKLYQRIDIALDSMPYNGHTTSLDSFWMGVPVVTQVGRTAVGRAGWCQLSNLGLAELAARTPEEFVRIAVAWAADLPRLSQLRSTLRQRMEASPLMDAPRFARNMEAAYRGMWRTWCATACQPAHLTDATASFDS
jgi:protein O-GlcNAc transferase